MFSWRNKQNISTLLKKGQTEVQQHLEEVTASDKGCIRKAVSVISAPKFTLWVINEITLVNIHMLINLKIHVLTIANSFLLNKAEHENFSTNTEKSLTDAQAFIRIIIFHEQGDGHLLEAIETCKSHMKVQNDQFLSNGRHLVFSENDW